jgi:hypothetical protein
LIFVYARKPTYYLKKDRMTVSSSAFVLFFFCMLVLMPTSSAYGRDSHNADFGLKKGQDLSEMFALGFYKDQDRKKVIAFLKGFGLPFNPGQHLGWEPGWELDYRAIADVWPRLEAPPVGQKSCRVCPENCFTLPSVLFQMKESRLFTKVAAGKEGDLGGGVPSAFYVMNRTAFFPPPPGQEKAQDALAVLKKLFTEFFSHYGKDVQVSITSEGEQMDFEIQVEGVRGGAMDDKNIYETYDIGASLSPLWREDTSMRLTLSIDSKYAPAPFGMKPPKERFHDIDSVNGNPFIKKLSNFICTKTGGHIDLQSRL